MSMRRRIPPEKVRTWLLAASASPNASSSSVARLRALAPRHAEQPADEHQVFVPGQILVDRGVLAREADLLAPAAASRATSSPRTVALPLLGLRSVVSTRMAVVFPAPFGPSRP